MKKAMLAIAVLTLSIATAGAQVVPGGNQGWDFARHGRRNGPNDGTGNQGQRPQNGQGNGSMTGQKKGGGVCDNTGPKGPTTAGRSRGGRR